MKIAIIGMGVAGISVLREWTKKRNLDPSIEITVFGDEGTFGTGKAYQADDAGLLMNQAAELTSMIPENDYDFVDWLRDHYGAKDPVGKFYPRVQFGEYVTERMNRWLDASNASVIQEKVDTVRMLPNGQYRLTSSSHTADFDAVHLCKGNLPYQDPYHVKNHPNAIHDPFPMLENLSDLPHGARVGVLGTGLTSIDVFRYVFAHRPDMHLAYFSRSGTFKTIIGKPSTIENRYFTKENITRTKKEGNGFIPLETYIEWFEKELENHSLSLGDLSLDCLGSRVSMERELADPQTIGAVQTVIKQITLLQTDLWMALTETDKHMFLEKYYKIWDALRAPFPPETGKEFVRAWNAQKFQVYENITSIETNEASFTCHIADAEPLEVDYMINATGNDLGVSAELETMPLLRQLVNERILQSEAFGGVQVQVPDLSAVSQKHGVLHTFKVHGQLIAGIQFGNSSVRIISKSAREAVQDIVRELGIREKG